ncbi:MAG: c-type cytochrome [Verrucomicrobiota bacterium]
MSPVWKRIRHLAILAGTMLFALPALRAVVSEDALPANADWISLATNAPAGTLFLRRTFPVEPGLVKGVLLAAADARADVFINGTNAGTASGFASAATLDVTRFLHAGVNVLAVRATNGAGTPAVRMMLELARADGRQQWLVSDPSWQASAAATGEWTKPGFAAAGWTPAVDHGAEGLKRWGNRFGATASADAYNSWMLARGAERATDPATFSVRPGFRVELLRTAQSGEDSWVALAMDPEGRITVAREQVGLLRFTLKGGQVDKAEVIEDTLKECRGLLYAHGSLYVNANNSRGFYRLRDADGDGKFEDQTLLLATEGGVGHGRNHLRLGPDGLIYIVHGDDVVLSKRLEVTSPVQQAANDALLPMLDPRQPTPVSRFIQVGHILQTDKDGSFFRLFATGLRNPMDVAFNADGEMFTYEADMERDIGAPWYRPTRILQIVPGGDYGWRRGMGNIPLWAPDTLPSALDVGVGSPTGAAFGTGSGFPEPYRSALFVGDWAYGRILAVFLKPKGATYEGKSEEFLSGRPLNITDLTFGADGAMYFVTGGRGTRSGLYRVSWGGGPVPWNPEPPDAGAVAARAARRKLESWTAGPAPELGVVWPALGNPDPWIRNAARRALERIPSKDWSARALAETNETRSVTALLALVRVSDNQVRADLFARLLRLPLATLSRDDQLTVFRIYSAAVLRLGWPGDDTAGAVIRQLLPLYPAADAERNEDLCRLLAHFRAPETIARSLPLLQSASSSEQRLNYLMSLWGLRTGWTLEQRRTFFEALRDAEQAHGARDYYSVVANLRKSLTNSMSSAERLALGGLVQAATRPAAAVLPTGPSVHEWTLPDFDLSSGLGVRSIAGGRAAFQAAGCIQCHRVGADGGVVGPDLTSVASRFGPRDLLDHILNPAKAVDEKYRLVAATLKDGTTVTGVVEQDGDPLVLQPTEAGAAPVEIPKARIQSRQFLEGSPMPSGLLDSLTRDQVLDLLAFLSKPQ